MSLSDAKPFTSVAYNCDEASGNLLDQSGNGYDATDVNTVGSASGLIDGARDFERGNVERFTLADNADISGADTDWTLCLYINPESMQDGSEVVNKWGGAGSREYLLRFVSSKLQFFVSSDGTSNTNITCDTFGTLTNGNWHSVACVHDATANEIRIYINGTKDSTSHAGGIADTSQQLAVGGDDQMDGLLDEVVILKGYAFTDADATEHHNGGAGVAWADWDAGGGFIDNTSNILTALWGGMALGA